VWTSHVAANGIRSEFRYDAEEIGRARRALERITQQTDFNRFLGSVRAKYDTESKFRLKSIQMAIGGGNQW
jgi:hypothetical protein